MPPQLLLSRFAIEIHRQIRFAGFTPLLSAANLGGQAAARCLNVGGSSVLFTPRNCRAFKPQPSAVHWSSELSATSTWQATWFWRTLAGTIGGNEKLMARTVLGST